MGLTCTWDTYGNTPILQPASRCPSPETANWCADSALTQRKSAIRWITSATSCSTWDFLWESPNWYYPAFKLSLETEYNMEWLQANSELLKGFWQKLEEEWARQKRNSLSAGQNPKASAWRPKATQANSVRSNCNYSDGQWACWLNSLTRLLSANASGEKILSIHAPRRPRVLS